MPERCGDSAGWSAPSPQPLTHPARDPGPVGAGVFLYGAPREPRTREFSPRAFFEFTHRVSGTRQRSGGMEKYSSVASRQAPEHGSNCIGLLPARIPPMYRVRSHGGSTGPTRRRSKARLPASGHFHLMPFGGADG